MRTLAAGLSVLVGFTAFGLSAGEEPRPLVSLAAVDEATGAAIDRFVVVPGTPFTDSRPGSVEVAAWQAHLAREASGGRYEWTKSRLYERFQLRVEANGYRPTTTGWLREDDAPIELTIRLRRDPGVSGVVRTPDGAPASGATLGVSLPNRPLWLEGATIDHAGEPPAADLTDRWRQPITAKADAEGRFHLAPESDPAALLVVVHEKGYLQRPFADLIGDAAAAREIKLEPWGRIEGRMLWGDRPAPGQSIAMIVYRETLYPGMVGTSGSARSDASGRFEFRLIPSGRVQLDRRLSDRDDDDAPQYQFPVKHVEVKAGGATEVVLGGPGQVVSGRLTGLDSYKGVTLRIHPRAPHIGLPGDDQQWKGWAALRKDSLGSTVFRDAVPVEPDGTFRIEGLVPERYQIMVNQADDKLRGGTEVTVEPASGERRQEPLVIRVTRG